MQDEVNNKTIALAIKGGKVTAETLEKALKKLLQEIEKSKQTHSQPKIYRGKQSVKHLVQQNTAINNIEITDGNIKAFQRTANKYGIDYALKKDTSEQPPKYLVFFKGKDIDVLTQAFKEFTANRVQRDKKPSIRKTLAKHIEAVKTQHREKMRDKDKSRGAER